MLDHPEFSSPHPTDAVMLASQCDNGFWPSEARQGDRPESEDGDTSLIALSSKVRTKEDPKNNNIKKENKQEPYR